MNDLKYKKSESYVAQQLQVLNDKIKEQNGVIRNLKAAIVDRDKAIVTLHQEMKLLREKNALLIHELPSDDL